MDKHYFNFHFIYTIVIKFEISNNKLNHFIFLKIGKLKYILKFSSDNYLIILINKQHIIKVFTSRCINKENTNYHHSKICKDIKIKMIDYVFSAIIFTIDHSNRNKSTYKHIIYV